MTHFDRISFDVAVHNFAADAPPDDSADDVVVQTINRRGEPAPPFMGLVVTPRVNGVPLIADDSPVFDATCILGQQLDTASFLPYTCMCGEPECAGIGRRAHMRVAGEGVTWRFPEEPFREKMPAELVADRRPITFRFALEQYAAALSDLADAFHPYFAGQAPVDFIVGVDGEKDHSGKTLEQMLAEFRLTQLAKIARQEQRERLFGALVGATIEMAWPDGARFCLHVETLADHLAYEVSPALGAARDAAHARVAAEFCALGPGLCSKVKEMGFRSLEQCASLIEPGSWDWDTDPEGGIEWLASRWDDVTFELVQSEMIGA
jgi:hypothetical protein